MMQKEIKSVRFLEGNLTRKVADTVIIEKRALLSPPLKRKTLEVLYTFAYLVSI